MVRGAAPKAHFAANSGRICFDWLAGGDECGANVEIRGEGGNTGANAKVAKVTQKAQKGIPKFGLGGKPARVARAGKAKKPTTSIYAGYRRKMA